MDKALIVINEQSGGYTADIKERIAAAAKGYQSRYADIDCDLAALLDEGGYALLVVAGGDGTLRSVLNKIGDKTIDVWYVPCGTLNERAKARRRFGGGQKLVVGEVNGQVYTYVLAAGSFTPIGYVTSVRAKKRLGRLAYLSKVLSEYKVHRIPATVTVDGQKEAGEYTLIMSIKCDRCFGFGFNRLYTPEDIGGHVLLIKSPKRGGLGGKIAIFFPFFRAFFLGFGKPYRSNNMLFAPYSAMRIDLKNACDFDVDGEKITLEGTVDLSFAEYPNKFEVLKP